MGLSKTFEALAAITVAALRRARSSPAVAGSTLPAFRAGLSGPDVPPGRR
jgi:hypothetical protein